MKIKLLIIIFIILVTLIGIRLFYINKYSSQIDEIKKYGAIDANKFLNTEIYDATIRGVGTELVFAIENEMNWDKLPLTDNFKNKYKNGNNIMPEHNNYSMISTGRDYDKNGNELIVLFCYNKQNFFDFFDNNPITTLYYYKYKLSNDNKLDSIELVNKEITDSTKITVS